jgi:hypothetical protein
VEVRQKKYGRWEQKMEQAMFAHKKLRFGVFVHLEERVKEILGRNKNLK